jgi:hypothetical protein
MKAYSIFRNEDEIENETTDERKRILPQIRFPEERCLPGYHFVEDYYRNRPGERSMVLEIDGIYVGEQCVKDRKRGPTDP